MMRSLVAAERGALAAAISGGVVRQIGFLGLPWCLERAVDRGLEGGNPLVTWSAAILVTVLVQVFGLFVWDWFSNLADARTGARLRGLLARRIIGDSRTTGRGEGDLLLRAGRDVDLVRVWVHGIATWAVIGATVVLLVPGLFSLSLELLLVAVATVPFLALIGTVYPRRFEAASDQVAQAHGARADDVGQVISAAVTVRGLGAQDVLAARHDHRSEEVTERSVRATDLLAQWRALGSGVPAVAVAVGVLVGVLAVLDGRLTVGGLVAFSAWMGTIGIAVQIGLIRASQAVEARVALDRLAVVLGPAGLTEEVEPAGVVDRGVQRLKAEGVVAPGCGGSVDLVARKGRLMLITGETGSGKSCLLRVLGGRTRPVRGEVTIDGRAGAPESVVIVPQRPVVMAGTVRENLTLGSSSHTDARLREVLREVALDQEITLDTELADGAGSLSGGQVQRLALARALVRAPDVLLLDEVTAAVDPATEQVVLETVCREAGRRVVIWAGHRPALRDAADDVVQLVATRDPAEVPG